ncbi:uncharacterized protein LOC130808442 [Amaranthus tricolor]|uniref:uncharacterized protein LOC130808442 n=1 Tax=Amaranthus tricolor TaxID=29722 RepID=UPI00258E66CE|nr:uncharacterized protein LOC130808442 [Amaranthus tricolor]
MAFFVNSCSVRHLNITWVTLIPKLDNPTSIEDYRPISMVDALYKIISKILTDRLKETDFRWCVDCERINKMVEKKKNFPGTLIKLDFQTAYDSVSWSFLELVMKKLGFGRKWIR